jgi:hypothetical protein
MWEEMLYCATAWPFSCKVQNAGGRERLEFAPFPCLTIDFGRFMDHDRRFAALQYDMPTLLCGCANQTPGLDTMYLLIAFAFGTLVCCWIWGEARIFTKCVITLRILSCVLRVQKLTHVLWRRGGARRIKSS